MSKESADKKPPSPLTVAICRNLQAYMKEAELNYRELAAYAKVSLKTAYNLINVEHNPKTDTVLNVSEALRISPLGLMHRGTLNLGLLASKRPERAIEALAKMPVDKQKQAVEMLEAMAK